MRRALDAGCGSLSGSRIYMLFLVAFAAVTLQEPAPGLAKSTSVRGSTASAAVSATAANQRSNPHEKNKHHAGSRKGTGKTATGKAATSTKHAKATRKHKRKHAGATRPAGAPRVAKTQRASKHARAGKRHHGKQLALRHRDPSKLVIPQGDGSPVLSVAATYLGRPYRFGSEGDAFDCSGFVRTVFADMGVDLPHSAREIAGFGDRVDRDELEPGDLVFFHNARRRFASHVGIYVGDNKFVHAATRAGQVQVDSLSDAYYARHYLCARRIET